MHKQNVCISIQKYTNRGRQRKERDWGLTVPSIIAESVR